MSASSIAAAAGAGGSADVTKPLTFMVAVDGSVISRACFEVVSKLARRGDRAVVVHVADSGKEYLPFEMKPEAITEYYERSCIARFPTGSWRVVMQEKRPGVETRKELLDIVKRKDLGGDILVVGFVGRKGPKEDPSVMGSSADFSLRAAHMTSIIVKRKDLGASGVFVVGVDGSDRAHVAVLTALRLVRPTDKVKIVHVEGLSASESSTMLAQKKYETGNVESRYADFVADKPNVEFTTVHRGASVSIADVLVNLCADESADFVVIGADGLGAFASGKKGVIGSVSDAVVRKAPCSVVCIQDTGITFSDISTTGPTRK